VENRGRGGTTRAALSRFAGIWLVKQGARKCNASNDRKQAFRCLQSLVIDGSSGKSTTELECVGFSGGIVFAENRL
jgi:hypothetical protein